MTGYRIRLAGAAGLLVAATAAGPFAPTGALAQTRTALASAVEEALDDERALRQLEVSVAGDEVTLAGSLRNFWEKSEALRITFDVPGVETVASEIVIPTAEDDQELANEVGREITRYPFYTMWDVIDGRVDDGVVRLRGMVTPGRDKARELFERIAKVRGVQDIQMNLQPLSPSSSDARIRSIIARQLARSTHFERFRAMRNPPFHIIVNRSIATLVGYVQGEIERLELQRIVAQTPGVLRVENRLQTQ
jgi:osmotically-inducible protein OsmY